jgi:transposase InsO family protein
MAFINCYPKQGLIVHSDRASQYASDNFTKKLKKLGFRQSMSRKGECRDNTVAESFFRSLNTELIHNKPYKTISTARGDIFNYVEVFYNWLRLHSTLGYLSPEEFEAQYKLKATA